jgi:hypothetical protein
MKRWKITLDLFWTVCGLFWYRISSGTDSFFIPYQTERLLEGPGFLYCPLPSAYCPLPLFTPPPLPLFTACLFTAYCPKTAHCSLSTVFFIIAHCLLPTVHCLLPNVHCPLANATVDWFIWCANSRECCHCIDVNYCNQCEVNLQLTI